MVASQQSAADVAAVRRRERRRRQVRHVISSYAYITPLLFNLIFLSAGPVLHSFIISFTNWQIVLPPVFVGVRNYTEQLSEPLFWKVMGNTFYYTVGYVPLSIVASLTMAILVNQK